MLTKWNNNRFFAKIINRSLGKSGQSNAYNWVCFEVCPSKKMSGIDTKLLTLLVSVIKMKEKSGFYFLF